LSEHSVITLHASSLWNVLYFVEVYYTLKTKVTTRFVTSDSTSLDSFLFHSKNSYCIIRCTNESIHTRYISLFFSVDYGSFFDYTLAWEKFVKENPNHPIHLLTYEDMKAVRCLLFSDTLTSY